MPSPEGSPVIAMRQNKIGLRGPVGEFDSETNTVTIRGKHGPRFSLNGNENGKNQSVENPLESKVIYQAPVVEKEVI